MAQVGAQQEIPKLVSVVNPIGIRISGLALGNDVRNGKDALMLNCYIDKTSSGYAAVKRPGTSLVAQPGILQSVRIGQGLFRTNFREFAIVSNIVYFYRFSSAPLAIPISVLRSDPFDFFEAVETGGAYIKSEFGLCRVDSLGTLIENCIDPDYPSQTVRGITYLEGTYYVMADSDGTVRGSDFENGFSWNPLNFIGGDGTYGRPAALNRHLNYIQAFYESGIIFYYNAGNPTGSPLSPVSNAVFRIGCLNGNSVIELMDRTFFLSKGQDSSGNGVSMFNGLTLTTISTMAVSRILDKDNLVGLSAYGLQIGGNSFYMLNLPNSNLTLVYSIETETWVTWTLFDPATNFSIPQNTFYTFSYINDLSINPIFQKNDGDVYEMPTTLYAGTDGIRDICFFIRTPPADWGTLKRKFIPDMAVIGDTGSYSLSVRYSNDDYQTHSNYRLVDMSKERKFLSRCGSTRRRSWDLQYIGPSAVRIFGLEVQPNPGAENYAG